MRSRSPLGLRGLKLFGLVPGIVAAPGRSPLGLRGLKSSAINPDTLVKASQPSWAAWIEIVAMVLKIAALAVAALLGCVD